jgi:hypothetical protein
LKSFGFIESVQLSEGDAGTSEITAQGGVKDFFFSPGLNKKVMSLQPSNT